MMFVHITIQVEEAVTCATPICVICWINFLLRKHVTFFHWINTQSYTRNLISFFFMLFLRNAFQEVPVINFSQFYFTKMQFILIWNNNRYYETNLFDIKKWNKKSVIFFYYHFLRNVVQKVTIIKWWYKPITHNLFRFYCSIIFCIICRYLLSCFDKSKLNELKVNDYHYD
jgi:hypothetical protein